MLLGGGTTMIPLKQGPQEKEQSSGWGFPGEPQVSGALSQLSISNQA